MVSSAFKRLKAVCPASARIDGRAPRLVSFAMPKSPRSPTNSIPAAVLGYLFHDSTLLKPALTHPSSTDQMQAERRLRYQRLEFLGDAVWCLFVTDALMEFCPSASEGELTLRRARLISAPALAQMAKVHGLPSLLALSAGEESTGGRQKVSILSSAFEAVIGAVYLDGGTEAIRRLARDACLNQLSHNTLVHDPKTALQELTQSRFRTAPRYRMLRRKGPAHAPMFDVEVRVGCSAIGQGTGRSKQEAERAAATAALASFSPRSPTTSGSDT